MSTQSGNAFYGKLGVNRLINGASWRTVLGGSIMPPAVVEAMEEASRWFVDLNDLNQKAGQVIARLTGAEAGLVTAGSAAGMLLEAAACMTGTDPANARRLPDTSGMKNEIVIHRAHRVSYDHNFRTAGARLVEIGVTGPTQEWDLEDAINENTAAVAFIFAGRQAGALPFAKVVEIAHARGVPVIVDAAAMLPPAENLTRYVEMGADMVSFSGGKGIMGPQSTGILCGRSDLMEAAYMNSAPNSDSVGRAAKVCKEEIAGLVTALEMFVDTDHEAVYAGWRAKCERIVSALQAVPDVKANLSVAMPELDEWEAATPRALIYLDRSWQGPSAAEVLQRLEDGEPSIRLGEMYPNGMSISPVNLMDGEEEIIATRLREILTGS